MAGLIAEALRASMQGASAHFCYSIGGLVPGELHRSELFHQRRETLPLYYPIEYIYGLINGEPVWGEYGYPIPDFPLLTTYDKDGNKMISWDWDTKRLTLSHGGQTKVYDYKNWTTSPGSDPTPEVCDSDVNDDGRVDVLDLQLLINCQDKIQPAGLCLDLNGDQRVDEQDIQSLIEEILIGD